MTLYYSLQCLLLWALCTINYSPTGADSSIEINGSDGSDQTTLTMYCEADHNTPLYQNTISPQRHMQSNNKQMNTKVAPSVECAYNYNIDSNQLTERKSNMEYNVIKNGKIWTIAPVSLDQCIRTIRLLESGLDRNVQHSPYTILPA